MTLLYLVPAAKTGVIADGVARPWSEAGRPRKAHRAREEKGKVRWEYPRQVQRLVRSILSGKDGKGVSSIPSEENPYPHNPKHTYRTYQDKIVSPDGKLLARIRQDAKGGSEVVPVKE